MQTNTAANTDRADQLEALGFSGETDYAQHQNVMQKMRDLTTYQLHATRAAGGLALVHLSETGRQAGRRLCLAPDDTVGRSVHAMHAPLHNPTFLSSVCETCPQVWALEAYNDDDEIPDYLIEVRQTATLARVKKEGAAGDEGHQ